MHCCGEQAHAFVAQRAELPGPAPFIAGVCSFLDPDPEGHMFFFVQASARHAMQRSSVGRRSRCFELKVLHVVSLYVLLL
jgi:hypothetical protein